MTFKDEPETGYGQAIFANSVVQKWSLPRGNLGEDLKR